MTTDTDLRETLDRVNRELAAAVAELAAAVDQLAAHRNMERRQELIVYDGYGVARYQGIVPVGAPFHIDWRRHGGALTVGAIMLRPVQP